MDLFQFIHFVFILYRNIRLLILNSFNVMAVIFCGGGGGFHHASTVFSLGFVMHFMKTSKIKVLVKESIHIKLTGDTRLIISFELLVIIIIYYTWIDRRRNGLSSYIRNSNHPRGQFYGWKDRPRSRFLLSLS